MTSGREFVCRFGVGDLDAVHLSVWRIWAGRNNPDLYIATRGTAGKAKVSIHASGKRHYGLTSQWVEESRQRGYHDLDDRHLERWQDGKALNPNLSLEYRLIFPTTELRQFDMPEGETSGAIWLPPAKSGHAVEVALLVGLDKRSEDWWPGRHSMSTQLLSEGRLSDGRWVWLVHRSTPAGSLRGNETLWKHRQWAEANGMTAETVTHQWRYYLSCTMGDGGRACVEVAPETIFAAEAPNSPDRP